MTREPERPSLKPPPEQRPVTRTRKEQQNQALAHRLRDNLKRRKSQKTAAPAPSHSGEA